jgi:hypothetical protein
MQGRLWGTSATRDWVRLKKQIKEDVARMTRMEAELKYVHGGGDRDNGRVDVGKRTTIHFAACIYQLTRHVTTLTPVTRITCHSKLNPRGRNLRLLELARMEYMTRAERAIFQDNALDLSIYVV